MKTILAEYKKDIKNIGGIRILTILLIGFFIGAFFVTMWLDSSFVGFGLRGAAETAVSDHLILKIQREDVVNEKLVYLIGGGNAGGYFCFPSSESKYEKIEHFYKKEIQKSGAK